MPPTEVPTILLQLGPDKTMEILTRETKMEVTFLENIEDRVAFTHILGIFPGMFQCLFWDLVG